MFNIHTCTHLYIIDQPHLSTRNLEEVMDDRKHVHVDVTRSVPTSQPEILWLGGGHCQQSLIMQTDRQGHYLDACSHDSLKTLGETGLE